MQLQVSSVRSLSFVGPQNEDTNLCQAKKYILVIYAIWLSIDMLFKQIRTVSLDKNHLYFRLSKNNYYAATSLKRAFPLVSRPVE